MLAELSQGRSCGRVARGGRGTVCRVEFSYPVRAAAATDHHTATVHGCVLSTYSRIVVHADTHEIVRETATVLVPR